MQIQSTLINLHPNEYSEEFHYYPLAVKVDRCVGSSNTLSDLPNKVCVPERFRRFTCKCVQYDYRKNESKF